MLKFSKSLKLSVLVGCPSSNYHIWAICVTSSVRKLWHTCILRWFCQGSASRNGITRASSNKSPKIWSDAIYKYTYIFKNATGQARLTFWQFPIVYLKHVEVSIACAQKSFVFVGECIHWVDLLFGARKKSRVWYLSQSPPHCSNCILQVSPGVMLVKVITALRSSIFGFLCSPMAMASSSGT